MFLSDELPANPVGWTKQMRSHFNYGPKGGAGFYSLNDAEGNDTGIAYQYDTRKGKNAAPTGYHVPAADTEVFGKWADLRAAWPEIIRKIKNQA